MKKTILILAVTLMLTSALFSGEIRGLIRNTTTTNGNLMIAAVGGTELDLMGMPSLRVPYPDYPYEYALEDSSIGFLTPFFVIAYQYSFLPMPVSGAPFGAYPDPVIPLGDITNDINIVLWSDGDIGGRIFYEGSFDHVRIDVFDGFSGFLGDPELESSHHIGGNRYFLGHLPSGLKQLRAYDDINRNRRFDEGEPFGWYTMSIVGFEIPFEYCICSGPNSAEGMDITIDFFDIDEQKALTDNIIVSTYPNPSASTTELSYTLPSGQYDLTVTDIQGRRLSRTPISGTGTMDIGADLPKGTYLYRISGEAGVKMGKIILTR